jgi:hypothetical protein
MSLSRPARRRLGETSERNCVPSPEFFLKWNHGRDSDPTLDTDASEVRNPTPPEIFSPTYDLVNREPAFRYEKQMAGVNSRPEIDTLGISTAKECTIEKVK